MKHVQSPDNAQFKMLLKLAGSPRACRLAGMTLLDGEHLIATCRESGVAVAMLVISESAMDRPVQKQLFEATAAAARLILSDRLFNAISPVKTSTGLLAAIKIPVSGAFPTEPETCLMLEAIQDPGNLGSMLRTGVAAGIRHVVLSSGCAFAWAPKIMRAGMGAHFKLDIHEHADLRGLALAFRGKTVAMEPRAVHSLYAARLTGPVAWLFGNEGTGLSDELANCAQERLRIPMPGPAESLNVAGALAVCLFEQVRQKMLAAAKGPLPQPSPARGGGTY